MIEPVKLCTVKLSFDVPKCNCRCFDLNNWEQANDAWCGEGFESGNYPIEACNGISGFYNSDIATEIRPKIKSMAETRRDQCGI